MSDYLEIHLKYTIERVTSDFRFSATEAEVVAAPGKLHRQIATLHRILNEMSETIRSVRFLDTLTEDELRRLHIMKNILSKSPDNHSDVAEFLKTLNTTGEGNDV